MVQKIPIFFYSRRTSYCLSG